MTSARLATTCLLLGVALAGCGDPSASPARPGVPAADLPPCPQQPSPPALRRVHGLSLPEEAVVYSLHRLGPLTQAEGVVELSPVDVRAYYEGRNDLRLLAVEDEGFEAEVLFTDGTHRMFIKAQVLCATASNFTATVAAEEDAGAVPTPAGVPQQEPAG